MEKEIYIKKGWLFIPVCATYGELPFGGKKNNRMLEIFCRENNSETKLFEFQIPAGEAEDETYPVSYYARFPVKQFTDKTLILRGDLGKAFFDGIRNEDVPETEEKSLRATQGEAFRRPSIHFTPQTGWMNDPNGFSYYQGEYHLFYQYYPYENKWGPMHWGHLSSKDMLAWKRLPVVMAPEESYDNFGCFSGSALELSDGRHLLMYTGVGYVGDTPMANGELPTHQTQCMAVGDGVNYEKYENNPVITGDDIPEGGSKVDFRDPKIWKEDGRFYALIGSKAEDGSGQKPRWFQMGICHRSGSQRCKTWQDVGMPGLLRS